VYCFLILFSRRDIFSAALFAARLLFFLQDIHTFFIIRFFSGPAQVCETSPLPVPDPNRSIETQGAPCTAATAMDNASVPQHTQIQEHTEATTFEAIHPNHNHVHRDDASVRTASITESTARNSANNEKGFSNVTRGVDIQRAEADFAELSKELSRASNISRRLSRVQSKQSRKDKVVTDVEKATVAGSDSSDEAFDLEATLRGGKDEEEAAGIKSKRIGVVWDGLTVSGIGMATLHHLYPRHALTVA
jgi:hypothetical protein